LHLFFLLLFLFLPLLGFLFSKFFRGLLLWLLCQPLCFSLLWLGSLPHEVVSVSYSRNFVVVVLEVWALYPLLVVKCKENFNWTSLDLSNLFFWDFFSSPEPS